MKKIFNISIGILLLFFSSCESFLKEENLSSEPASEYYATADGYETLVNACYSTLRDVFGHDPWVWCAGTDLYLGASTQQDICVYKDLNAQDSYCEDIYSNLYNAIQYCNTAIYYNDRTEESEALAQRLAEVRFLRAFYYFKLVQQFGGVAIVDNMVNEALTSFSRNSEEDIYTFIIEELGNIIGDLPETADEAGRITQQAAYHYLAKVYLTRGYQDFGSSSDFTKAASYAESAINGEGLNLTYEELFTPGNEINDEVIFSVQYDAASILSSSVSGNDQNYYFGPSLGGGSTGSYEFPFRSGTLCPTLYMLDLYSSMDSRWEASFMNVVYEPYYAYYTQADALDELEVTYYYPQSWEVADTAEWRVASSMRTNATINPYSEDWEATISSTIYETPIVKKFDDPDSDHSKDGSSTRDIYLARLAETYLIAAEAYFQSGNTSKAAENINVVRTRAAKSGYETQMQIAAGDVDLDLILDERARELIGEYHRWEDLARTGTLVERTQLYNSEIKSYFDQGINPFEGIDGELKLLRPIPQSALDLNQDEGFIQNPGYN